MDYFDYWISNVLSSAKLIADPSALELTWTGKTKSLTSAYDVVELLEQMLGDLRLPESIELLRVQLQTLGALEEISQLTSALVALDQLLRIDPAFEHPDVLLGSPVWENLQLLAERVVGSLNTIYLPNR